VRFPSASRLQIAPAHARARANANGARIETRLDAVADKKDSRKWNSLRRMKWCNDPLAEERVA
jgi:hypothetical protein